MLGLVRIDPLPAIIKPGEGNYTTTCGDVSASRVSSCQIADLGGMGFISEGRRQLTRRAALLSAELIDTLNRSLAGSESSDDHHPVANMRIDATCYTARLTTYSRGFMLAHEKKLAPTLTLATINLINGIGGLIPVMARPAG
jgi:hypothetical protein